MNRRLCSLCTRGTRSYSVASKTRRSKPPSFSSPPPPPPPPPSPLSSPSTPLDASLKHITPSSGLRGGARTELPTPGSSSLAKSAIGQSREPPLVEAARRKSVKQRNVFESYLVLNWKTRLYFWVVIGAVAVAGLYGGDYLLPETEEEKIAKGEKAIEETKKV